MIIGITGRSGAGKSYLSEILATKLNMLHLDIDKISHEILSFSDTQTFLKKEFGEIIFENSVLNRKKLGQIVFNDKNSLEKLNQFCQIQIENRLDEIINNSSQDIILDYALLPKLKQFSECDLKILLTADIEIRFDRVSKRENISKDYFLSRDSSLEDIKNIEFDFIFDNISNSNINDLMKQIEHKKRSLWLEKQQLLLADLEI